MQIILALSKKRRSEWIVLELDNYIQGQDILNRLSYALSVGYVQANGLHLQISTWNDPKKRPYFPRQICNKELEEWLQFLIDRSYDDDCKLWQWHKTPRCPWIQILGRNYEVKPFTMRFLYGESFNGKKISNTCNNKFCVNPNHMLACFGPKQKLRDPQRVLSYIDEHPELTQRQVAELFGCSEAVISRLVNGRCFKGLDRSSQYVI